MLVRGVIRHEIQHHLEPMGMGFRQERIEVGQGAEHGMHICVIGYVVAEIHHGRGIDGRDPDGVDAQIGQIAEPALDAFQITDAVMVAVLKGAWVDLIDDAFLPPARLAHEVLISRLPCLILRPRMEPRPCSVPSADSRKPQRAPALAARRGIRPHIPDRTSPSADKEGVPVAQLLPPSASRASLAPPSKGCGMARPSGERGKTHG